MDVTEMNQRDQRLTISIPTNAVEKQILEDAAKNAGRPLASLAREFLNAYAQGKIPLPPVVIRPNESNMGEFS